MLGPGLIPLTPMESEAIANLLAKHPGPASLTRRDPGEQGPVLVYVADDCWQVDADGTMRKQRKPRR